MGFLTLLGLAFLLVIGLLGLPRTAFVGAMIYIIHLAGNFGGPFFSWNGVATVILVIALICALLMDSFEFFSSP